MTALQEQIIGLLCNGDVCKRRKRQEIFHALTILGEPRGCPLQSPEKRNQGGFIVGA